MAIQIGTAHTTHASRLMLLGAGELGKEVAIEAQRLGLEVIAVDRYPGAPAMQVAHRAHVIDMLDGAALERVVRREQPALIVPEVEAIATEKLLDLEADGFHVVPSARATRLTMDREGIRRLAAEELGLPTSPYEFAGDVEACREAVARIGVPCVVKPVMSSSGKGQVVVQDPIETDHAWSQAVAGGRGGKARVIVEGFVEFDYEITLLTVRHKDGTRFCAPIGHLQVAGDYRQSWQPQAMTIAALEASEAIATAITNALGGHGIFGVELFIRGDEVLFSEVSPRPHDTGMVTLVSQNLSEFSLHVRAILGFPINGIEQLGPSASVAILGTGEGRDIRYGNLENALAVPQSDIRIFGKPEVFGERRLGVALARGADVDEARSRALEVARRIEITISEGDTQS